MPNYAAQVTLFPTSNLVEDAVVNTFSCAADDNAAAALFGTALSDRFKAYATQFPSTVRQNNHTVKIYDRADPEPRAPVVTQTWSFAAAPTGNPCPPEVAHCLSFQANPASGIPQARRRGRVYLGPLDANTIDTAGRPSSALMTATVAFGQALLDASDAAASWEWTVWSETNGAPYIITNGWADDEFDTQRRRGRKATFRQVFN